MLQNNTDVLTIIIPQENVDDIQDIKKEMSLDDFTIHFVSNMDEVLKLAFVKNPFDKKTIGKSLSDGRKKVRGKQGEGKRPMKKRPTKKVKTT